MSSTREHHAKAEQLLEQARTTRGQSSRSLILAEAQVHATLALSAPPATSPPSPGQAQTGSTASTGEPLPVQPSGDISYTPLPYRPPGERRAGHRIPAGQESLPPADRGTPRQRAGSPAVRTPTPPGTSRPHPLNPARATRGNRNPTRRGSHPQRVTPVNRPPGASRPPSRPQVP